MNSLNILWTTNLDKPVLCFLCKLIWEFELRKSWRARQHVSSSGKMSGFFYRRCLCPGLKTLSMAEAQARHSWRNQKCASQKTMSFHFSGLSTYNPSHLNLSTWLLALLLLILIIQYACLVCLSPHHHFKTCHMNLAASGKPLLWERKKVFPL